MSIPIALRPSLKDSPCQECQDLKNLSDELLQNFSLLAETGYAEGVMCHTLVKEGDTARYVQPSPNPTFAMRVLWHTYLAKNGDHTLLSDINKIFKKYFGFKPRVNLLLV